jgi:hypothetical protein
MSKGAKPTSAESPRRPAPAAVALAALGLARRLRERSTHMTKRIVCLVALVALCCGSVSCQRLADQESVQGTLRFEPSQITDSIPASYGRLVAVTSSAAFPGWAQLWFEKEDQTIVTVFLDYQTGKVRPQILTIPRS